MRYYKILNKDETHHGLQYKTGLNTDILLFHPKGSCEPGGIYFAKEDILAFLNYGPWIREVTLPKDEEIYFEKGDPGKYKAHQVILSERRRIDLSVIKELVEEGADIHVDRDYALRHAADNGYFDIVKHLIEQGADIHVDGDYALKYAADNGHLDIVKYLAEQGANIHADYDYALRYAAANGHLNVVEYLERFIKNKGTK